MLKVLDKIQIRVRHILTQFAIKIGKIVPYLKAEQKAIFFFNRLIGKNRHPAPEDKRWCFAPWNESVILSDGTVICGCAVAYSFFPLGNIKKNSFSEIWNGRRYRKLRKKIIKNPDNFYLCYRCGLNVPVTEKNRSLIDKRIKGIELPKRMHIEPTVRCNLDCEACAIRNLYQDRDEHFMSFDTFKKIMDEVGEHLEYLGFFNYGETFIHPDAVKMLEYAKRVNPNMYIHASTNGHFFKTKEKQEAVLRSGVDEVLFSIDGTSQASYARYRIKGNFDVAFNTMREMIELKKELGLEKPKITWRYILFRWNDSDEEMERARQMAKDIGVDQFCWLLTNIPEHAYSRKYLPGTEAYEKIKHELF